MDCEGLDMSPVLFDGSLCWVRVLLLGLFRGVESRRLLLLLLVIMLEVLLVMLEVLFVGWVLVGGKVLVDGKVLIVVLSASYGFKGVGDCGGLTLLKVGG